MSTWFTDAPFFRRKRAVDSWPSWQATHRGVNPILFALSIVAPFFRSRRTTDSRPWKEAQFKGEHPSLSAQFARLPSRRKIRAALRASPATQAAMRASGVAASGIFPRAVEWRQDKLAAASAVV